MTQQGDELDLIVYKLTGTHIIKDTLMHNYDKLKNQDILNLNQGIELEIPTINPGPTHSIRDQLYD